MSSAPTIKNYPVPYQTIFLGKFQQVSITSSNLESAAFGNGTNIIKIFCTKDCWVQLGVNPTATQAGPDSAIIRGGIIQYIGVKPGWKISVIRTTENGTMDITEGAQD
jgi:hypothetical protein